MTEGFSLRKLAKRFLRLFEPEEIKKLRRNAKETLKKMREHSIPPDPKEKDRRNQGFLHHCALYLSKQDFEEAMTLIETLQPALLSELLKQDNFLETPLQKLRYRDTPSPTVRQIPQSGGLEPSSSPLPLSLREVKVDLDLNTSHPLARGSFGAVHQAHFQGRLVAVKRQHITFDKFDLERFTKEANMLANLKHPNILEYVGVVLHTFSFNKQPGIQWIVTELAERSLLELLKDKRPLSWQEAAPIFSQIIAAVEYLHRQSIIHRDIKPANILLFAGNRIAKLCDFGEARRFEQPIEKESQMTAVGTPCYRAPEVISRVYNQSADLYSLGITLVHTLTGTVPKIFQMPEERTKHIKQLLNLPSLPPELSDLIVECVHNTPAERPSAAQLADRFKALLPR